MILQITAAVDEIIVLLCGLDLQAVAFWEIAGESAIPVQESMVSLTKSISTLWKNIKRIAWYEGYE